MKADESLRSKVRNMKIRSVPIKKPDTEIIVLANVLVPLALLPLILSPVQIAPFIGVFYLMIFAMSWDLVTGYTGQLNLGHALFFAIGGYTTTILNLQHGIHPVASITVGITAAGFVGLLIAIPALRIRGFYLALLTLISPFIFEQFLILFNDELRPEIFGFSLAIAPEGLGGTDGFLFSPTPLVGTPSNSLLTVGTFQAEILANYYFALLVLLVSLGIFWKITRSMLGDVLTAIREDEDAVEASGINPARFKTFAFVVSAMFAGLAGALFVHSPNGIAIPELLINFQISINVIIMVILGGIGTITGALIGTMVFVFIQGLFDPEDAIFGTLEFLQFEIPLIGYTPGELQPLPVLIISLLILYYLPKGITPTLIRFME